MRLFRTLHAFFSNSCTLELLRSVYVDNFLWHVVITSRFFAFETNTIFEHRSRTREFLVTPLNSTNVKRLSRRCRYSYRNVRRYVFPPITRPGSRLPILLGGKDLTSPYSSVVYVRSEKNVNGFTSRARAFLFPPIIDRYVTFWRKLRKRACTCRRFTPGGCSSSGRSNWTHSAGANNSFRRFVTGVYVPCMVVFRPIDESGNARFVVDCYFGVYFRAHHVGRRLLRLPVARNATNDNYERVSLVPFLSVRYYRKMIRGARASLG